MKSIGEMAMHIQLNETSVSPRCLMNWYKALTNAQVKTKLPSLLNKHHCPTKQFGCVVCRGLNFKEFFYGVYVESLGWPRGCFLSTHGQKRNLNHSYVSLLFTSYTFVFLCDTSLEIADYYANYNWWIYSHSLWIFQDSALAVIPA